MTFAERYAFGDGERVALRMVPCIAHESVNPLPERTEELDGLEDFAENDAPETASETHFANQDDEIAQTLDLLCPGAPVEIRVLTDKGMRIRRFADHATAVKFARQFDSSPRTKAIYVVMNPYNESLIKGKAVHDGSITRRTWLLIDIDPARETDTNSTDEERALARAIADKIKIYLTTQGWPAPIEADSSNGSHLIYCIDLLNDAQSLGIVRGVLVHLAAKFDAPGAQVDQSVANASRIVKLYGTVSRKGPATPDRPHRRSAITQIPTLVVVPVATLQQIATPKTLSAQLYGVAAFLGKHWPANGAQTNQHDLAAYAAGFLCQHGVDPKFVPEIVEVAVTLGRDDHVADRVRYAQDTVEKFKTGEQKLAGGPHLAKEIGKDVVARLCELLPDERQVDLIRAADVPVVKLEWLWPARLARGAITLVEGGPEKGKSTILVDLAARVSRGHSFPGEQATREPGNVVMLIAEDDLQTTVVPRLMAAGADLQRVFFLGATKDERGEIVPFHLSDDYGRLRLQCQEVKAEFVVVDPLVSFLGSRKGRILNTNNDLEVRKALGPLKALAEQLRASVAAIRHYRKGNGTDAMEAGGGSVGFSALVRVIIAALPDPDADDDDHYLLAVAKNNLIPKKKRPAFAYEIVPWEKDPDIGRIAWGGTVDMSAGEILVAQADAEKDTSGKAAEARVFLETFLASGEWVATTEIMKAAKETHGLSEESVRRARAKLPITAEKRGVPWGWKLDTSAPSDQGASELAF